MGRTSSLAVKIGNQLPVCAIKSHVKVQGKFKIDKTPQLLNRSSYIHQISFQHITRTLLPLVICIQCVENNDVFKSILFTRVTSS